MNDNSLLSSQQSTVPQSDHLRGVVLMMPSFRTRDNIIECHHRNTFVARQYIN